MKQRRAPASLVAALLVLSSFGFAGAGEPPGGWTIPVKVRTASDDRGHDAVVVSDRMHAAFARAEDGDAASIQYGTNDNAGAEWSWEVVRELESVIDLRPAIALDANGFVYIAYQYRTAAGQEGVEVVSNSGGDWAVDVLAGPGGLDLGNAGFPDIALQTDGAPAVVFVGSQQGPCTGPADLYMSQLSGGTWTPPTDISTNDTACRQHTYPALAEGPDGLHLAYRSIGGGPTEAPGLRYRSGSLTNATDEEVDDGSGGGGVLEKGVDIVVDASGVPHVAYVMGAIEACCLQLVRYATRDGGVWSSEDVDGGDPDKPSGAVSIALGTDGPAIGFSRGRKAFVAEKTVDGWTVKNLNSESTANRAPVVASIAGERLHALLVRLADKDQLMYMHEAPRATAQFAVAGSQLEGGDPIDMSGDLGPSTVKEQIKIETQRKRDGAWIANDLAKLQTKADGSFDFTHDGLRGGRKYRSRLVWGDTIDHLRGKTVWDNFDVDRKRAH